MKTKIIEATNNNVNWGKFLLGRMDTEWVYHSSITERPLLREIGWTPTTNHLWVMDLQTREGACFWVHPSGFAGADLAKHKIWVCPLFEPFLVWLYAQPSLEFDDLPGFVNLPDAPTALYGYRRGGT